MDVKSFIQNIRTLIANDDLSAAFQHLHKLLANSPKLDESIIQSARFHDIRRGIRLGIVSCAEANLTKSQIRDGLLDLLREIESQGMQPGIRKEVKQAVATQKTIIQNAKKIYNINTIDNANFS